MFKLSKENEELIHRVFGGTKIIRDSVVTVYMDDIYRTKCGNIVVVYKYGAKFMDSFDTYLSQSNENYPTFEWDEPLDESV